MQSIGVILAAFAVWFLYCGTHGLQPIALLRAVIAKPDQAGKTVDDAVQAAKDSVYVFPDTPDDSTGTTGPSGGVVGTNPWAGRQVTTPYGQQGHAGTFGAAHTHAGVDYAMPVGTALPAVLTGTALPGFGVLSGTTMTVTGTGNYKGWQSIYMHLSHIVETGPVKVGEVIAESGGAAGASGSGDSTGPHLHFEMHHNGKVVDPASFWQWVASNQSNLGK